MTSVRLVLISLLGCASLARAERLPIVADQFQCRLVVSAPSGDRTIGEAGQLLTLARVHDATTTASVLRTRSSYKGAFLFPGEDTRVNVQLGFEFAFERVPDSGGVVVRAAYRPCHYVGVFPVSGPSTEIACKSVVDPFAAGSGFVPMERDGSGEWVLPVASFGESGRAPARGQTAIITCQHVRTLP